MSDLATAAAAMGLPESLVERSAEARAAETGASVDEILGQWASGEATPGSPAPSAPEAEEPAPAEETAEETADEKPAQAAPEVTIEVPGEPKPSTRPPAPAAGPYKPPILVGARDNPMTVLAGVIGLFVIVVMVGLVGPSIATESPGARTSEIPFSDAAVDGREVYAVSGCAACHTQMARPVVADVGLGPVTLNDTNQVLGTRRFGPDLSDVGARVTPAQIEAIIGGLDTHPVHSLDVDDLNSLVAYLSESASSGGGS
jgi:hypothetical protein